jgi:prefoldin alpha subunit
MDREQFMQLQMREQEAEQLNQHSQMIDKNISDMQELNSSLDEIENSNGNEILVNIGKKVYLPVKISEKHLIVDVGNNSFVKKSSKDTKETIDEQIKKLIEAKGQIFERLQDLENRMRELISNNIKPDSCDCSKSEEEGHVCDCGKNHKH